MSIIVPAYNEEVGVVASLRNQLRQDYPAYDIVFVDGGSRDHTLSRVKEAFADEARIRIYYALFRSYVKALRGELQSWGVLGVWDMCRAEVWINLY